MAVILLALFLASFCFGQATPAPIKIDGPLSFELKPEDIIKVLEIQRAQYQALSDRNQAQAAALQAEKDTRKAQDQLDTYNQAMTKLRDELRIANKCPDCELQAPQSGFVRSTDIHFVRVFPQSVTSYEGKTP